MGSRFFVRGAIVGAMTVMLAAVAAPALAQGQGTLHGRILDAAGAPVADATVTFTFIGDYDRTFTTKTDAKGLWLKSALIPGRWNIVVDKGNLVGKLNGVTVLIGQNVAVPDIALAPGAPASPGALTPRVLIVTVLDAKGAPVSGLAAADFAITEDSASRQVIEAKPVADPWFISLLVDTTKPALGVNPPTRELRSSLSAFVKTVLAANPNTQIELVEFGGVAMTTVNFTSSAADLEKAIQRIVMSQRSAGVLLEGWIESAKGLGKKSSARKALVSINFNSVESSALQVGPVTNEILKSGAAVWAVSIERDDPVSVQNRNQANSPTRELLLGRLPGLTGGTRLQGLEPPALEPLLKQIADCLTTQYAVTYARPSGVTPQVTLASSPKGAKVLAPRSSFEGAVPAATKLSAEEVAKHNKRQGELEQMFKDGDAAAEAGNFDDAIAKFTAIATEVPKCASCQSKIGDVYLKKGDLENAEKSFLKAIEIDPNQADAYAALASVYNAQKKFDEASKMSAKANELKGAAGGSDPAVVFNQGIIFWNQSKIADAKAQFLKAIELDPKMADAHYWLGMSFVNEGKLPDAKKPFEEYLKLAPTGQYADTAKAILAQIK